MADLKTTYRHEGMEGQAYLIAEYRGASRIFWWRAYYNGSTHFTMYPKCAVVKGERREKKRLHVSQVERGRLNVR